MEAPKVDAIIDKYIELRDAKEKIMNDAKATCEQMNVAMAGIEAYMMELAKTTGQTNFGSANGTAFITTETRCNVADWDQVLKFAKENNMWEIITKGVSKKVVADYLEKHEELPPGVNWSAAKVIQIRRK